MSAEIDAITSTIGALAANSDELRNQKAEAERLLEELRNLKNKVEAKKSNFNEQLFQQRSRIDALSRITHVEFA